MFSPDQTRPAREQPKWWAATRGGQQGLCVCGWVVDIKMNIVHSIVDDNRGGERKDEQEQEQQYN